jgi:hypothetical protein
LVQCVSSDLIAFLPDNAERVPASTSSTTSTTSVYSSSTGQFDWPMVTRITAPTWSAHSVSTIGQIDAAFASLGHGRADALFLAPDAFLNSCGVQIATLAARDRIPAAYATPQISAAGGLMS